MRNSDGNPISIPFLDLTWSMTGASLQTRYWNSSPKLLRVSFRHAVFPGRKVSSRPQRRDHQHPGRACRRVESLPTRSETQEKAVKMIPDRTGRFRERPYYELSELEERSEQADRRAGLAP